MLSLDSPRWAALRASPGGTGELAARLLRDIRAGAGADPKRAVIPGRVEF
jgi:hypothetical protein